jgi:hypothetical protein
MRPHFPQILRQPDPDFFRVGAADIGPIWSGVVQKSAIKYYIINILTYFSCCLTA